jgi:hypothetical protein
MHLRLISLHMNYSGFDIWGEYSHKNAQRVWLLTKLVFRPKTAKICSLEEAGRLYLYI